MNWRTGGFGLGFSCELVLIVCGRLITWAGSVSCDT